MSSESRWIGRVGLRGNRLLTYAVGFELGMLAVFLLCRQAPSWLGWGIALLAVPVVLLVDGLHKGLRARRRP